MSCRYLPNIVCSICRLPWFDPVQTNCGDIFCSGCISKWLISKTDCPSCRNPVNKATTLPIRQANPPLSKILGSLRVRCALHAAAGCYWVGSYSDIQSDLDTGCTAPVQCKYIRQIVPVLTVPKAGSDPADVDSSKIQDLKGCDAIILQKRYIDAPCILSERRYSVPLE